MTELKRLEEILYILHKERVNCEFDMGLSAEQLLSLWARIRRYEGELEERRLALGIVRS